MVRPPYIWSMWQGPYRLASYEHATIDYRKVVSYGRAS